MKIPPEDTLIVMDRLQLSIDRYAHLIEEHLGGGNTDIANCLSAVQKKLQMMLDEYKAAL